MTKDNVVKRYEWEDALIEAECLGLLESGAVNMCLRLAKAITWEPKDGRVSGLYWKNETALKSVRSSKATYHRHRDSLFEVGFLIEKSGNLIPQVPDLSQIETNKDDGKSQIETKESQIETAKSQIETKESQIDNPYTVHSFTGDSGTGDKVSVVSLAGAHETANLDSHEPEDTKDSDTSCESASSTESTSSSTEDIVEDQNTCELDISGSTTPPEGRSTPPQGNLERVVMHVVEAGGMRLDPRDYENALRELQAQTMDVTERTVWIINGESIKKRAMTKEFSLSGCAKDRLRAAHQTMVAELQEAKTA